MRQIVSIPNFYICCVWQQQQKFPQTKEKQTNKQKPTQQQQKPSDTVKQNWIYFKE